MSVQNLSLEAVDDINDRLHKASGIAGMIRASEGNVSDYALVNAAWVIERLLEEVRSLINGDKPLPEARA